MKRKGMFRLFDLSFGGGDVYHRFFYEPPSQVTAAQITRKPPLSRIPSPPKERRISSFRYRRNIFLFWRGSTFPTLTLTPLWILFYPSSGGMGNVSEEERSPGQVGTVTTNGARLNVENGSRS
ncbi:MAG: hypothetical protein ACOX1Q_04230 [Eubacteriales bacterium]